MSRGKSKATWEVVDVIDLDTYRRVASVGSRDEARVWMRTKGLDGHAYSATHVDPPVTVTIERVERRMLNLGDSPKPKRVRKQRAAAEDLGEKNPDGHYTCPKCGGGGHDADGDDCTRCEGRGWVDPK